MHDRSAWTRGRTGETEINGHTYKNLTEFYRPCATCGNNFSIYVTGRVAAGHADSNSFGLKNCEEHRRNRPKSDSDGPKLHAANVTMAEELKGLYARVQEQFEEIQRLKARLALYELPAAFAAAQTEQPFTTGPLQMRAPVAPDFAVYGTPEASNSMPADVQPQAPANLTYPWQQG